MFPFPACAGEIAAGDRFFVYFFRANTAPAAEGRRAPQALAPAPGLDVRRGALLTALCRSALGCARFRSVGVACQSFFCYFFLFFGEFASHTALDVA